MCWCFKSVDSDENKYLDEDLKTSLTNVCIAYIKERPRINNWKYVYYDLSMSYPKIFDTLLEVSVYNKNICVVYQVSEIRKMIDLQKYKLAKRNSISLINKI